MSKVALQPQPVAGRAPSKGLSPKNDLTAPPGCYKKTDHHHSPVTVSLFAEDGLTARLGWRVGGVLRHLLSNGGYQVVDAYLLSAAGGRQNGEL